MSGHRFALIDPAAGISGDMLLGAIVAAGAEPSWLQGLPGRLGLADVSVRVEEVDRCGIRCVKVTVVAPGGASEPPADPLRHGAHHHHHHEHHHHDHGPHRHVGELMRAVESAPVSAWVRERAVQAFRLLGLAEGRVHGVPPDDVPLHEVGAVDALVDIVGAIEGFEQLGIRDVRTRPVALGQGWVRAAHGILPVPAPATALLAEGLAIGPDGPVEGEATTPTGAALLRVLAAGPAPVLWRATGSGWGAGTRDPGHYPNALRLILAEAAPEAGDVTVLACDLDDLSPEYLEPLREAMTAAGALDVQAWATQAKKGRIGFRVEALVPAGREDAVTEAAFRHSTTGGVRWTRAERRTVPRHQVRHRTAAGEIRVKVLETPGGPRAKPEYDDVTAVARATGRPALEVAAEARAAVEQLDAAAAPGRRIEPKECP